jgi:RNA polymerase sigma-70 factor (ECF subfamily)
VPESGRDEAGVGDPHQSHTDEEYIAGVRAGDQGIFNALVLTYFSLLVHVVVGIIHLQDAAEDLVQDVLYRIWEQRTTWNPRGPVRAYLLRAVRNQALDWLKHTAIEQRYRHEGVDLEETQAPAADLALIRAQDSVALAQALTELPERRRLAVQLRYGQQLSHAEIGEVLGISPKAVKELLLRTIEALRRRLDPPV